MSVTGKEKQEALEFEANLDYRLKDCLKKSKNLIFIYYLASKSK